MCGSRKIAPRIKSFPHAVQRRHLFVGECAAVDAQLVDGAFEPPPDRDVQLVARFDRPQVQQPNPVSYVEISS